MGERAEPMLLRPLSIGEIFDRAITLFVRNWLPFTIVGAIAILPSHVFMFLARITDDPTLAALWTAAYFFASLLMVTTTMATAKIVARLYRSQDAQWQGALGTAFARIFSAFGAYITMILIAIVPLLITVGFPVGLGAFRFANVFDDVLAVPAGLCGVAIFVGFSFAGVYALNAMVIDDLRAMEAVGRALGLFNRTTGWRTLLVGLAQVVIVVGGSSVAGAVGQLIVAAHQPALATLVQTLIVFVTGVYGNIVTSVYFFDVAIRSEGYDIQLALDAMPS